MTTKTNTITDNRKIDVVTDVLCNVCGESLHPECAPPGNYEGLVDKTICGGYGSRLGDGIAYNFSICEKCLEEKIFPMFKDPPKIDHSDWLGGGVIDEHGKPLEYEEEDNTPV